MSDCGGCGGADEGVAGATGRRVVVLIDMDCFYCQVEEALQPILRGKPLAVVQYNPWKGGGIIAVNYAARARGVTRHMRGDDARAACPDIQLCSVPCVRGKADISKYREAGQRVAKVLQRFTPLLERASIDEAYLDITQPVEARLSAGDVDWNEVATCADTYAVGYESWADLAAELRAGAGEGARALAVGALLVRDIRAAVLRDTGYECSAGIAHNKMLAKLVCGLNKPNKQTVLVERQLGTLYATLPLRRLRHLGGKFGERVCRELGVTVAADLQRFSRAALHARFQYKNGNWLYAVARGADDEPVRARFSSQSIGCCKKFGGAAALAHERDLRRWLRDLADEIEERLQRDALDNDRRPRHMVVSFTYAAPAGDVAASRSHALPVSLDRDVDADLLYTLARRLIADTLAYEEDSKLPMPIKFLGLSVGKFDDKTDNKKHKTIVDFFTPQSSDSVQKGSVNDTDLNHVTVSETGESSVYQHLKVNVTDGVECNEAMPLSDKCEKNLKDDNATDRIDCNKPVLISDKCEKILRDNVTDGAECNESMPLSDKCEKNCIEVNATDYGDCNLISDNCEQNLRGKVTDGAECNKSVLIANNCENGVSFVQNFLNDKLQNTVESEQVHAEKRACAASTGQTECPRCGERLPSDALQTHLDYHLAVELSEGDEALRGEQRSTEPLALAPSSIRRYLVRAKSEGGVGDVCGECGRSVPPTETLQHADFHLARRLSTQLNRRPLAAPALTPVPASSAPPPGKRKRLNHAPNKAKKPCATLYTFFR